jgi:DNA repair exonuclease SbcCD ATPase subunit
VTRHSLKVPLQILETLQAILTEVRALRQELRISLTRVHSTQILLSRYPMRQGAVARASEHFDEARSKLAEIQVRQREVAGKVKRLEEAMSAEENLQQPKAVKDRINPVKSELEVTGDTEQQLGAEPDRLSTLETQLDDSVPSMGNAVEPSGRNRP